MKNPEDPNQYNLTFNEGDVKKNKEIDKRVFKEEILKLADFKKHRLGSFVSMVNRELFNSKHDYSELKEKILEIFDGESPFEGDKEEDVTENNIITPDLIDEESENIIKNTDINAGSFVEKSLPNGDK